MGLMMQDLIKRLEAATEGSRELDREIGMVIEPCLCERVKTELAWRADIGMFWVLGATKRCVTAPHYTTSIDAAITLVPEGWYWTIERDGSVTLVNDETLQYISVKAPTPALALCIASLKARGHE